MTRAEGNATVPAKAGPPRARTLLLAVAALVVSLLFVILVLVVAVILVWIVLGAMNALPDPDRQWPRLSAWAIVAIPVVALLLAFLINRGRGRAHVLRPADGQRRISLLLLVAMVGLVVALGEAIAASLTFDSYGALIGAGIAALVGVGAAAFAHFSGPGTVLSSARARKLTSGPPRVLTRFCSTW